MDQCAWPRKYFSPQSERNTARCRQIINPIFEILYQNISQYHALDDMFRNFSYIVPFKLNKLRKCQFWPSRSQCNGISCGISSCSNVFWNSHISFIIWNTFFVWSRDKIKRFGCKKRNVIDRAVWNPELKKRSSLGSPMTIGPDSEAFTKSSQSLSITYSTEYFRPYLCSDFVQVIKEVTLAGSKLSRSFLTWTGDSLGLGSCIFHTLLQSSCHLHQTVASLRDKDFISGHLIYLVLS